MILLSYNILNKGEACKREGYTPLKSSGGFQTNSSALQTSKNGQAVDDKKNFILFPNKKEIHVE